MFASDVKPSARLAAIALRNEAKAFLDNTGYEANTAASKLDAALRDAPAWQISQLSSHFFERSYGSLLEKEAIEARIEMNVDPVALAASGIGLRTFLRMKAGALRNADILADLLVEEVAEAEASIAARSPSLRASRRRYLREIGRREFGLLDALAIQRRYAIEPQKQHLPLYGLNDRIVCPTGLALRVPTEKEVRVLAKDWEDGWLELSPQNAIQGRAYPLSSRVQVALGMRSQYKLIGIFDGNALVGNLVINRVSETQVEIGWFTRPAYRGRGIATAALEGMLADLNRLGIEEVGAQCFPGNKASMRITAKLGLEPLPGEIPVEGAVEWISFKGRTDDFERRRCSGPGF